MKLIKLTKGKFAEVDDEDFEYLKLYSWHTTAGQKTNYAQMRDYSKCKKGKTIKMHRLIMKVDGDKLIDHKDGNGLNNQKDNLRICNKFENQRNRTANAKSTSQYLGVSYDKINNKWRAAVKCEGKYYSIGRYNTEKEAAFYYNEKVKILFKEYARLNVI